MRTLAIFLLSLFLAAPAFAEDVWPGTFVRACAPLGGVANPDETGTVYVDLTDGSSSATEDDQDSFIAPIDIIIRDLRVKVDVAPGGSEVWNVILYTENGGTNVTCNITGAATTCNSGSLSDIIPAGDDLSIRITETGPGSPAAAAEMHAIVCLSGG